MAVLKEQQLVTILVAWRVSYLVEWKGIYSVDRKVVKMVF